MNSPSPLLDALTTEELRMSFQYTLEDLQGLGAEPYLTDGTSTNSSGSSPVFVGSSPQWLESLANCSATSCTGRKYELRAVHGPSDECPTL